jgi:hypothetical protein
MGCDNESPTRAAPNLVSIAVTSQPTKTTYTTGEAFTSAGLAVSATYDDGSSVTVTDYTLSWNGASLAGGSTAITAGTGTKTVTVSYGGQTAGFDITVIGADAVLVSIAVVSPPTKTTYTVGDAFSSAGLIVNASYDDGNSGNVTNYTLSWNGTALAEDSAAITAATGTKTVTVAYEGQTTGFNISVNTGSQPPSGEVTGLTAIPGDKTITLTWTNPADEDFDHVEITFIPTAGGISQPIMVTGAQTRSVAGLTSGTTYTFTVKAVDTSGNKSQGESASATPVDISTGTSFTIAGTEDWTNTLALISSDSNGTGSDPRVYNLDIQGAVSVPGVGSSENSINGNYKIVRLTGTGTLSLSDSGSIFHIGSSSQTLIIDGPSLNNTLAVSIEDIEDLVNNNVALVYAGDGMVELRNGVISGNVSSSSHGGGVYVGNGTFTMSGGTISGNAIFNLTETPIDAYGGGVYVGNGTFTMEGGEISGNEAFTSGYAYACGGGVFVSGGSFTMSGGEISGNTTSYLGGGVYIAKNGRFEMINGEISGNEALYSGGVYVSGGSFTMEGGEISDNEAKQDGGGVSGPFTMSGGKISGNTAGRDGGGIAGRETFTMLGGTISGNSAGSDGGGAYIWSCSFTMSGGEISGNSAGRGGGVFVVDQNDNRYADSDVEGNFSKTGGSIIYGSDETGIDEEGNGLKNTAEDGDTWGHAVYYALYNNSVGTYYYHDTTLNAGDDISTDTLPTESGETLGNWTKREVE